MELVLVITTEEDFLKAESLSRCLLEKRLAACISLQEIHSQYWWEENLEKKHEVQLLIKTTKKQLENLSKAIKQFHSYETPELISWPVSAAQSYGEWAMEVIRPCDS